MTILKSVTSMALATIVSRILGFARIMVIAAVLGTTALGNTFQSTNSISNILFDLLAAGALSAAIVPSLVKALTKSKKDMDQLVGSLLSVAIIILGAITIVSLFYAQDISEILFSRAPIETRALQIEKGTILLRFFLPQIILYGIGAISLAVLTAKKRFVVTAIAPVGSSIVIIISLGIFWFTTRSSSLELTTGSIIILGLAGTLACLTFVAIPYIAAIKSNVRMIPSLNMKAGLETLSSSVWAIAIQASAAIVLGATIFIGNNVNGAVVAYQLAFVFFLAPYGIISQSFSTVLLPDLSEVSDTDETKFKRLISLMMTYTYRPMFIATGFLFAIGIPLMQMATHGRAQDGVELVAVSFLVLIVGLVPYSIYQAASRVFFAKGNIRLPAVSVLLTSIAVSLACILISRDISGIAVVYVMGLAHTITYLISAGILLIILHKQSFEVLPNKFTTLIIISSLVYGVIGLMISRLFDFDSLVFSAVYVAAFSSLSLLLLYLVLPKSRINELKTLVRLNKSN